MKTATIVAIAAATALTASAVAAWAQSVQPPAGSYRTTCTNINAWIGPNDGRVVSARCRAANGTLVQSSLRFDRCRGDIANINGQLTCRTSPPPGPGGPGGPGPGPGPGGPGPGPGMSASITLYGQPGYRGSSITLRGPTPSFAPWSFGDKAKSVQVRGRGRWQVCTKINYGGRCEIIGDSVYDLGTWRLSNQISSARPIGR